MFDNISHVMILSSNSELWRAAVHYQKNGTFDDLYIVISLNLSIFHNHIPANLPIGQYYVSAS